MTEEATKEEAIALLRSAAWTENGPDFESCPNCGWREKEPRTLIHTSASGIGCDWDVDSAVAFIGRATAVEWGQSIFGHDLFVDADGRTIQFEVKAPEQAENA